LEPDIFYWSCLSDEGGYFYERAETLTGDENDGVEGFTVTETYNPGEYRDLEELSKQFRHFMEDLGLNKA
jgi:hypothetical protein